MLICCSKKKKLYVFPWTTKLANSIAGCISVEFIRYRVWCDVTSGTIVELDTDDLILKY